MSPDPQSTPCQRGCCWTPHGVCATSYQCGHHRADHKRAIDEATTGPTPSRLIFSHTSKQEPQRLPAAEQVIRDSILQPAFSHQEQNT